MALSDVVRLARQLEKYGASLFILDTALRAHLRQQARNQKITGYSRMNKAALLQALEASE
jgi:hypothetical protein